MMKIVFMIGGILAVLIVSPNTVTAQSYSSWQTKRGTNFISAGACRSDSRHCVRLQCLTMDGGGVHWMIDAPAPDYSAESTSVEWKVDAASVSLPMNKAGPADNGMQSYDATFNQANHQNLVRLLKSGNLLTVGSDQFAPFSLSLQGSGAALVTLLAECPLTAATGKASGNPAFESFSEPYDVVLVLMAKQGCAATESEIFTAITKAGFGAWDANLFIAEGAKDGTLSLIDKLDDIYTYRLSECSGKKSALAVDPTATELTLTADQLPQPVRAIIGDITEICGDAFKTREPSEKAILGEDVDGDGTYDFLINHRRFCPDAALTMCGASRCSMTLFVSANGDWRRFDFTSQDYKELTSQGLLFECSADARKAGVFMENGELVRRDCAESSPKLQNPG